MDNLSIVIYSANFGNYREELKNGIDNIFFENGIDYIFFTDNKEIKSEYWNIIYVDLQPELEFIDAFRHTSKYIKFLVPEIIKKYDIIIWIDTKNLDKIFFDKNQIIKLFYNKNNIFFIKHECRINAQEELEATIYYRMEHFDNGNIFLNEIRNINFTACLPDTTCIVYMNTLDNILLLRDVYDTLILKGLRRDQNVIQYVWLKNNYEDKISYFNIVDLQHIKVIDELIKEIL